MPQFLHLLLSVGMLTTRGVPSDTTLHVRLTNTIGSYATKAGDPVRAVLIAPVKAGGQTILRAGATLSGQVASVRRVGLGLIHETAALGLDFNRITLVNGQSFPISARVTQVDNSRERVTKEGRIEGVRSTGSPCYRASGYIRTLLMWHLHAELAIWAVKTLVVQVPEPEIYYPAGVEMTLKLEEPAFPNQPEAGDGGPRTLSSEDKSAINGLVAELPVRTSTPTDRPSDLINLLILGSREEIAAAFTAAGWTEAHQVSMRTRVRGIQAFAENRGYSAAPMSSLVLNETEADMSLQKGLNDFSKRHHIRLWRQPGTWNGREVWVAAATRDIDYAFMRPGRIFTHKIEANVDRERDKVADDLVFTNCVDVADESARRMIPAFTRNATGDTMRTDTRLSILQLNACRDPRLSTASDDTAPVRARGERMYRFARREILSVKSDLLRDNLYWRSYEGVRWAVEAIIKHRRDAALAAAAFPPLPPAGAALESATLAAALP